MAETLVVASSDEVLSEAAAISYGDADICDYSWYFSLELRDRARWWNDMESIGIFPYSEFIEMTTEWFHDDDNSARAKILIDVTTMMLDAALESQE